MEIAARSDSQKCRWCVTGPGFNFPHPSLPLLSFPFVWASSPLAEGNSAAAASPLYQQRPHSRRTKLNRWRGSQPPGRAAGARNAAGGRVILSRWYRRTPKKHNNRNMKKQKQKGKQSNRIGINVGATLPSLRLHSWENKRNVHFLFWLLPLRLL